MNPDLQRFIEQDLFNELRWMLVAASEWNASVATDFRPVDHFQVIAMDSTFLHARALYEFFIDGQNPTWNPRPDTANAKRDFNVSIVPTATYRQYIDGINKRLFHLDINRPTPEKGGNPIPGKDVNDKVVVVAQDVLDAWDKFASLAPAYKSIMDQKRSQAIKDAHAASKSCRHPVKVFV